MKLVAIYNRQPTIRSSALLRSAPPVTAQQSGDGSRTLFIGCGFAALGNLRNPPSELDVNTESRRVVVGIETLPVKRGSKAIEMWPRSEYGTASDRESGTTARARRMLLVCIVTLRLLSVDLAARSGSVDSKPLSQPADTSDGPMFEDLSASRTGIDFNFYWNPPKRYRWHFDNTVGGGVAIGDYDADGLPDVYLTRAFGGGRLYRNLGDFRFEDATDGAGLYGDGSWEMGATFVDIDNDGDLDLFVCGYDSPNRLFFNRGDGTFDEHAERSGLDFSGSSIMMAFADYDRDGDLDGYLLTNRYIPAKEEILEARLIKKDGHLVIPDEVSDLVDIMVKPDGREKVIKIGQEDLLYRNHGDGSFSEVTDEAGITGRDMGLGVVWWDYDHDGWPDLYVSNDFYGPDKLYRNNGDGSFTNVIERTVPHTPWFSMGTDVADINNDGLLDLFASDMAATTHYKAKTNMGEMEEQSWFLTSARPPQYMANSVYLNSGTDRFFEVSRLLGLGSTDWTWSVKFADFDNDGWVDLFVTNGMTRNWFNSDMRAKLYLLGGLKTEKGGRLFLDAPPLAEANLVFRNLGGLRFKKPDDSWGLGHIGVSFGAAKADLDGDGDLDLVVNNFDAPASIYRNRSHGSNRIKIRLIGTASNRYGVGALVRLKTRSGTQVRYQTLARGFASSDDPIIHFGLGVEETIDEITVDWPSGRSQTLQELAANRFYSITEPEDPTADLRPPKERRPMFARMENFTEVVHRENPYDDFVDQPLLPNRMSQLGPGLAWGDFNGDGKEGFFVGGGSGQPGRIYQVYLADGEIRMESHSDFESDALSEDMGALSFDADSDGDLDLYVVSGGVGRWAFDKALGDRLYLNNGHGNFVEAPKEALPKNSDSGSCVTAGDFDRDGDLDLFIGGRYIPRNYPITPVSRLLRNDMGRFKDVTEELAPGLRKVGLVTSALWSDANDDGWPDLFVTREWGPVTLYLNQEGSFRNVTAGAGLSERSGWWNSIAGRDLDNDGDIDYVVTNLGLNTKYHASKQKPTLLYCGDLGPSDRMRLIEADYEGDRLYPIRGKSCSTDAMPHLALNFESFHAFAAATLPELYSERRLAQAERYEIDTLESGVLINDGKAEFTFRPLPHLAQAAPGFGIVLTEINGDGITDLYMVQNFFGPQPETGRMDGGVSLLLQGNGDSTFKPVWPNRSGLVVSGDAKGLTATDLDSDGWVDFAVTVNDGPMIAFRNRGSDINRPLTVKLQGGPGNPNAVGARVTLLLDNGLQQTAEVHAGSGYLSQSTPTLFFGLGESGHATRFEIRWPDGSTTTHNTAADKTHHLISQPAAD